LTLIGTWECDELASFDGWRPVGSDSNRGQEAESDEFVHDERLILAKLFEREKVQYYE
jgi:hypothetical protein